MSSRDEWLQRLGGVNRAPVKGRLAPHKPLLVLFLLGRMQRRGTSEVSFVEAEEVVDRLLAEYGTYNTKKPSTTAYPFHHLATDGFWTVDNGTDGGVAPSAGALRAADATGRFDSDLEDALRSDPGLLVLAARGFLDEWPESLQAELASAAGLDLEAGEILAAGTRVTELVEQRRHRDATFRERVLVAYERRCAFCDFDGRLDAVTVAIEAAHVRWWRHDGPDEVDNGLALCSLHHNLFDRGVLGLRPDQRIRVSRHFVGGGAAADAMVLDLHDREARRPQAGEPPVAEPHLDWHAQHVFRQPARG